MKPKAFLILQISTLVLTLIASQMLAVHGLADEASVDYLTLVPDWTFDGVQNGAQLGASVHTAGDLNGDGFDDIVIGAPFYIPPGESDKNGAAFIFYGSGSSTPLASTQDLLLTIDSQAPHFGNAVSHAGDVNGDGFDDLLVGAVDYQLVFDGKNGEPKSGAVFLFLGSEAGLSETPSWSYYAEASEIQLGYAIAGAGDVNKDGFDDILVGAPRFESDPELENEGKAYLFFGSESGPGNMPNWSFQCGQAAAQCGYAVASAGDLNNDGYDDIVIGAPYYNNPEIDEGAAFVFLGADSGPALVYDRLLQSDQPDAVFGTSVAGAGDVNGDQYDDLIVGAPYYDRDESNLNYGAAFLFMGSTTGVGLNYDAILSIPDVFQPDTGDRFGISVNHIGDINQDGFGDVLVGADYFGTENSINQKDEGAVFLFTGINDGLNLFPQWFASGDKAEAYFGFSASKAGDINGDGGIDIIVGAPNYRYDQKIVMGRAFVYLNTMEDFRNYYYQVFIPLTLSD